MFDTSARILNYKRMNLRFVFCFVLFLLLSDIAVAQKNTLDTSYTACTIFGIAPGRAGHVIGIYEYDDYITHSERKLMESIVDDSGRFSLTFEMHEVRQVFIRCKNVYGNVFAEPGHKTEVIFPDRDEKSQVNPNVEYKVNVSIYLDDSTEMNALADDYNIRFLNWWKKNYIYLVVKDSVAVLDSFHRAMSLHYAYVTNPYFMPWMDYSFASLEDGTFHSQISLNKKYLRNKPVYHHNVAYMEFFNSFFKDFVYKWSMRKEGEGIRFAINQMASYDSLLGTLKRLPFLQNDTIRELVMLKGLFELYDNPAFNSKNILAVAQQCAAASKLAEHRRIARNIVSFYTKLKRGSAAPHFMSKAKNGTEVDVLDINKGKYIYLFFFDTRNAHSMAELRYMSELQKKYGKKIVFVSVCMDEDTNTWKSFVKANPKYNWTLVHYNNYQKTKDDYNLYSVPAGFIIDPEGKFYASPADNPSGDLEYLLYRIANPRAAPLTHVNDR
jgi:Thioredoxin-like